jgi:uncharacterized protein (DUF305 family)
MRQLITSSLTALGFLVTGAVAQDKMAMGGMSVLPQVCRDALKDVKMPQMMEGMARSKMMGGGGTSGTDQMPMTDARKESMQTMMMMGMVMMATHQIKDPDLAFNCGMIVHHQAAIDVSNIEIKHGKDDASKTMAVTIIKAQKAEIEEMTARVQKFTTK